MRFMMFVRLSADYAGKAGPNAEDTARMHTYNEELTRAGVLLALDGLAPMTEGARIEFSGGRGHVVDGPFAELKEVVGGYWIIQVSSREEAVEWARRCPMDDGDAIEVRRVFDLEEFPQDVQDAARLSKTPPAQAGG